MLKLQICVVGNSQWDLSQASSVGISLLQDGKYTQKMKNKIMQTLPVEVVGKV